jgi:hypothetical protein
VVDEAGEAAAPTVLGFEAMPPALMGAAAVVVEEEALVFVVIFVDEGA